MKTFLSVFVTLIMFSAKGQSILSGKITDKNNLPISGASISIKDSYDGSTSSADGNFNFTTTLTGNHMLVIQCIGYKSMEENIDLSKENKNLIFLLQDSSRSIDAVTIVAGAFDASDEKKSVAFKPMDIVTTPSASGDIYGALSTLPGAQTVGEAGKLFVRGGDEYEARTFIDGLQVESPYQQRAQGIPTKGRFSPLLFSGTVFSTGGYSAEYGQALSSVVLLKTDGAPAGDKIDVNLYSLGAGISATKKYQKWAYIAAVDYTNLGPYFHVVPQTSDWKKAPQTVTGTFNLINQTKFGISKTLISYNDDQSALNYPYYGYDKPNALLTLINRNLFIKNSFVTDLSHGTVMRTGLAFTLDRNNLGLDTLAIRDRYSSGEFKIAFENKLTNWNKLVYGGNILLRRFNEAIVVNAVQQNLHFTDLQNSLFAESEFRFNPRFTFRAGARMEYSSVIDAWRTMPRASLAYRIGSHGQVSAAYGIFFQNPLSYYLKFTNVLQPEKASHYIINYQYKLGDRLFRIEGFYKDYEHLVRFQSENDPNPANYNNSGYGFARGVDVFYRDSKSIKNGDFWISYSLLDTRKLYQDYLQYSTPKFFSKHNLSIVYKQWVSSLKSFFGMTYTYASGRGYYDPNKTLSQYLTDKTKPYHNLSLNYSYDMSGLLKKPVTFYCSVNNVLGSQNIFGYNNAFNAARGNYDLIPVTQQASRFYLIAFFLSI